MKTLKISKRGGRIIFCLTALVAIAIIILHHNPNADIQDEFIKKVISCAVILVAGVCFVCFYDKVTSLPIELWQNRHLIWKLAKMISRKGMQVLILAWSGLWCNR